MSRDGQQMESEWRIELLGGLRAQRGDQVITRFQKQKAGVLLAYLAYYPRAHSREALAELLWPGIDPESGRNSLRVTLHALRQQLELVATAEQSLIVADRTAIALRPDAFTTDVADWDSARRAASRAASREERAALLAVAAVLWRGELLPEQYEEWVLTERSRRTAEYLEAMHELVSALEAAGDLERAIEYAERAVSTDLLREESHYELMRLYAAAGQPSATLRQYRELERILREELGEAPSATTRALAEELHDNARAVVVARSARTVEFPAPGPPPPAVTPSSLQPGPPSVSSPVRAPIGLPPQFTRFFGREEEIARAAEALCHFDTRLITLTGPGGSGKTRLAIAVAGRLAERFGGAVAFVPLADLASSSPLDGGAQAVQRRVEKAVADALGLPPSPELEPLEQVIGALRGQPWLLVLDSLEHLLEEGARVIRSLLERVPSLTCLVTSRQRLNLAAEQEFAILPLGTPRRADPAARLQEYPSVQLFLDRAQAVRPEFRITEENAAAVAQLCDRLEGLPLAIELAAARIGVLTPLQMLAHLERRFEFLVSHQRDRPARHRTLRAAVEGSYALLDPSLQGFFARLSVFRGGWTLGAAEAVCQAGEERRPSPPPRCGRRLGGWRAPGREADSDGGRAPGQALDHLEQLRECSLVVVEEQGDELRYRLLETLREYARDRLQERGDAAAVRTRHRDWFLALAEQAEPELSGPHRREWLDLLEREYDNIRAALRELVETGEAEPGLRLTAALVPFWEGRWHLAEGRGSLDAVLALPGATAPQAARAKALCGAGLLARLQEDRAAAQAFWTESLNLSRLMNELRGIAEALEGLGDLHALAFEYESAEAHYQESLAIRRESGDRWGTARLLHAMAGLAYDRGKYADARAMHQEALALNRELDNRRGQAKDLHGLGRLALEQGDCPSARAALEESLAIQRELEDHWGAGQTLFSLGQAAFEQGDYPAARAFWEETLAIDLAKMNRGGYVVFCLARLAAAQGDAARARAGYEAFVIQERQAGTKTGVPDGLAALGDLALQHGDAATARARYEEALTIYREVGDQWEILTCLYNLWHLAHRRGDAVATAELREQSQVVHQELENPSILASSLQQRATLARYEGYFMEAESLYRRSMALYREMQHRKGIAACLEGWAGLAAAQGRLEQSARLCGAAEALRVVAGRSTSPIDRADYQETMAAARASPTFSTAWAEGRAMPPEGAIAYALSGWADESLQPQPKVVGQ